MKYLNLLNLLILHKALWNGSFIKSDKGVILIVHVIYFLFWIFFVIGLVSVYALMSNKVWRSWKFGSTFVARVSLDMAMCRSEMSFERSKGTKFLGANLTRIRLQLFVNLKTTKKSFWELLWLKMTFIFLYILWG